MDGNNTNGVEVQNKTDQNLQKTLEDLVKVLSPPKKVEDDSCIEIHQKALDDLVNVNSLFTIAVFIGLSFATPNQRSLENRPECDPDPGLTRRLILYEVNSFACFLLSSLVAKSIKILLNISKNRTQKDHLWVPDALCKKVLLSEPWKRFSLGLSIFSSFAGILLLTLSMVNVIQIRVGKLSCGSDYSFRAVVSLCVIVFVAMLFYVPSMLYAMIVTASAYEATSHDEEKMKNPPKGSAVV